MAISKISKITIISLSFSLLLLLSPLETKAQELSIIFYVSGSDMRTIYLPGPVKVKKVNIYACADQNRNGGFQIDIALLYNNIQVAYQGTLHYARSNCPMWSYGGSAEETALDFGGTSADAIKIIPVLGFGTYYQMFVSYEEGYEPPVVQCGSENTIAEFFNFSVPWCQQGDFRLPAPVKIHLVNLYGCCDQNRDGGCSDNIALLYSGSQVAYQGTLRYGRSSCPMWSGGQSPTASALNFGGVLTNTIRAVPTGRCGAAIYRIFYTHEPEECNQPLPPAVDIKANGSNGPITIPYNTAANLTWTSTNATACTASNGWSGSKPTAGSESTGNLTSSKTYILTCTGPGGSNFDSVTVQLPPNNPPSANNLKATQLNYCNIDWAHAVFAWNFTDLDGDTQSAYQVQVDNNPIFSSVPLPVDSGKVPCTPPCSYATLPGKLSWNTTYYWQLTVWDSRDWPSTDWIVYQNNVPPPESFDTPLHAYPVAKNFTWIPLKSAAKETVTFSPPVQPASVVPTWSWNIPDAIYVGGTNSASKNPQVQFNSAGEHVVSLTVTDAPPHSSYSCQSSASINVQLPLPDWKEIPPF